MGRVRGTFLSHAVRRPFRKSPGEGGCGGWVSVMQGTDVCFMGERLAEDMSHRSTGLCLKNNCILTMAGPRCVSQMCNLREGHQLRAVLNTSLQEVFLCRIRKVKKGRMLRGWGLLIPAEDTAPSVATVLKSRETQREI